MTFDEFINKYDGKKIDYDGFHDGQCVDLYRQYVKEVLEFPQSPPVEGAKDVWDTYLKDKYTRVANTPDGIPDKGDIVIWNSGAGTYGHIAIFIEGTTGSFKSFDQNWPAGSSCHIQRHYYSNVLGWLKPVKREDNMITDEQKRILKFLQEQNATEGDVRAGIGYVRDKTVERLETDVKSLKTQVNDLIKRTSEQDLSIKELSQKLKEAQQSIDNYQTDLKTANSKITRLEKQIETKEQELVASKEVANKYQRLYKEALDKSAEKLTSWELLKLFVKKISWKK